MTDSTKGYHKLSIHKHPINSPYKLLEEFTEYIDALASGNKIMAIQELSDLYGCIENEISKFSLTMSDLKTMSDVTKKVFKEGTRFADTFTTPKNIIHYLKNNCDSIDSYGLGFIQVKCDNINYNFYHKDIDLFDSVSSPHNHQQDFVSEVLKGSLTEKLYTVIPGSTKAFCGCGDEDLVMHLDASYLTTNTYKTDDIYLRLKNEYHSVVGTHGTVTKVTKYGKKDNAFVIHEGETSNTKHIPELALWRMVNDVLNVPKE